MRAKLSLLFARSAVALALIQTSGAAQAAPANSANDALEFHELMRSSLAPEMQNDSALSTIHMIPDKAVLDAIAAPSASAAMKSVSSTTLSNLIANTLKQPAHNRLDADQALTKNPLTVVIVPGIFGEFITTRGFEDVLSKPSRERDQFKAKVAAANASGDPSAQDPSYDPLKLAEVPMSLADLVHVGSLTDAHGATVARVVLLYTPFMSLESMGSLKEHAAIFNRRLEKYLKLTGQQNLALVGYSRGTVLGLEMLAQAKAQNISWLPSVKAMISLGGVTWGSTLADDTKNTKSAMGAMITEVEKLRDGLNPNSMFSTWATEAAFAKAAARLAPQLSQHANMPNEADLKASPIPTGTDPLSMLNLIASAWMKLGLNKPLDFANNVRRFHALLDAVLSGVDQLTSQSRETWWKTHTLPKSVTYYAITAAMANPDASKLDQAIFDGPYGYSHRSYDDLMLLQNRLDYQTIGGIALNDSQVSVAQAMFLPEAAATLNAENAGLKTSFLGTVGTHHWGLALRVVNEMKDGRMNPFPREALLKALVAKVALDQSK